MLKTGCGEKVACIIQMGRRKRKLALGQNSLHYAPKPWVDIIAQTVRL